MKKKIFDKSLMLEGLSQLKLPGLIFLIISVFGSVLPAVFSWINYQRQCNMYGLTSANVASIRIINISGVASILIPIIYLAPFVFCLVLFSFLNSRKGSDYYHSLSATRVSLFLSYTVSILIWLAVIVAATVFSASFIYAISGMIFNPAFIPCLLLTFFAGAVLVTACMLIAMSITGTVFTNIILCGLILFLPRFATTIATYSITRSFPIITSNAGGLANVNCNIPAKLVYRYMLNISSSGKAQLYTSVSSIVYTLILAVIYIAIACLLFHLRKSETAGSGAPNRVLQHVYRCIVTLPVALLIPLILSTYTPSASEQSSFKSYFQSNMPVIIALAIVSIFIYFLYELLTAKTVKKMLKSAPILLMVAAICVVFGLSIQLARNNILDFTPSSSEIQSVSVLTTDTNNSISNSSDYNDYIVRDLRLTDNSTISAVSQILRDNVNTLKSGNSVNSLNFSNNYYVGIHLKNGKYVERVLFASKAQSSNILTCLKANSDYVNSATLLPPESSINVVCVDPVSDKASVNKLWESYKTEFATLSASDKQSAIECYHAQQQGQVTTTCLAEIQVDGALNLDTYVNHYAITYKTPKTAAMYLETFAKKKAIAKSLMSSYSSNYKIFSTCGITLYNNPSITNQSKFSSSDDTISLASFNLEDSDISSDKVSKCFNILLKQIDNPVDLTKPYVCVSIGGKKDSYSYYQAISNDDAQAISDLKLSQNN